MGYVHAKVIKVLESDDRKEKVEILERHDGLFEFRYGVERNDGGLSSSGPYWSTVWYSGLYSKADETECDARAQVSWLRTPI